MSDVYGSIRDYVHSNVHGELLGEWEHTYYGGARKGKAYWIGMPDMIGSEQPDGSRMAIHINNYRAHSDSNGYREIIKRFDELSAKYFPPRKQLVKRGEGAPTGRTVTPEPQMQNVPLHTEEGAAIRKAFAHDLLGQSHGVVAGEQPGTQNIVKDEQRPLLRKRGSPS